MLNSRGFAIGVAAVTRLSIVGSKSGIAKNREQSMQLICVAFVLRAPLSSQENWTLGLTWDPTSYEIKALIHGMARNEMSTLLAALTNAGTTACHPLTMLFVLCEMLSDSDGNGVRHQAANLYKVEFKTNFHGFYHSDYHPVCLFT